MKDSKITFGYRKGTQIRILEFVNYPSIGECENSIRHRELIAQGFRVVRVDEGE